MRGAGGGVAVALGARREAVVISVQGTGWAARVLASRRKNLPESNIGTTLAAMALARAAQLRLAITAHGLADYPPGATFGPRTLRDYEFVLIVEGDVLWMSDGVE